MSDDTEKRERRYYSRGQPSSTDDYNAVVGYILDALDVLRRGKSHARYDQVVKNVQRNRRKFETWARVGSDESRDILEHLAGRTIVGSVSHSLRRLTRRKP